MDSETANKPKRRRGVRASRTKLILAMHEAGFKTQAAIAEHIADTENLEQAPKDLVNRTFREKRVELLTLQRIASALDSNADDLILAEQARDNDAEAPQETASSKAEADSRFAATSDKNSAPDLQTIGPQQRAIKKAQAWLGTLFLLSFLLASWVSLSSEEDSHTAGALPTLAVVDKQRPSQ